MHFKAVHDVEIDGEKRSGAGGHSRWSERSMQFRSDGPKWNTLFQC